MHAFARTAPPEVVASFAYPKIKLADVDCAAEVSFAPQRVEDIG
jgi:hypothetical protein